MATIQFHYKPYRDAHAPVIPLRVFAGKRWRRIWTYVDSGAAYSVLTQEDARRLGLLKIKARRLAVTTSGGHTLQISLHRLWAKLGNEKLSITFGVPRGFDVDFNLLGRRDVFRRFIIAFDDARGILTFIPHGKKR